MQNPNIIPDNMPLIFRRPRDVPPAPHAPVIRTMIPSPNGELEILSALPEDPSANQSVPPLFFVHGGFGCAAVWTEYMTYLSNTPHNIPCYAISLRGHGASWYPGYLRMVYGTGKRALADDIATGVRYVQMAEEMRRRRDEKCSLDPVRVVLVAHANGGGLAQLALNDGLFQVRGLALLESAPSFGIMGVYWNWLKLDPWFGLRALWHHGHPRSPLSNTELVKKAFFSKQESNCLVHRFETLMSPFESLLWPLGLLFRYVSVKRVLQNVLGLDRRPAVLIMAAERSTLMDVPMMQRMANEYRFHVEQYSNAATSGELSPKSELSSPLDSTDCVTFHVVKGAGHHLQNDVQWEDGAERLTEFYRGCCR